MSNEMPTAPSRGQQGAPDGRLVLLRAVVDRPGPPARLADLVAAYLGASYPGLCRLRQTRPHFDPERGRTTDPVEHTVELFHLLAEDGLLGADRTALRLAAVFHDVGKLADPFAISHPLVSVELAQPELAPLELPAADLQTVLALVRTHDQIGRVLQGWVSQDELFERLASSRRLFELNVRLGRADIASIRGLAQAVISGEFDRAVEELRADLPWS